MGGAAVLDGTLCPPSSYLYLPPTRVCMEFGMLVGISISLLCMSLHGIRHVSRHLYQPLVYKACMEFDMFVGISTSLLCIKSVLLQHASRHLY